MIRWMLGVGLAIGTFGFAPGSFGPAVLGAAEKVPLRVELRPVKAQSPRNLWGAVEIRLINESDRTIQVYDPLVNGLLWKHAVVLAVLDNDGEYRGDLLMRTHGSVVSTTKNDWVSLPHGGTIAKRHEIPHGQFYDGQLGIQQLHADDLLELRLHAHALAGRPSDFIRIERERSTRSYARFHELYPERFPKPEMKVAEDRDEPLDQRNPFTYREWERTFPGEQIGVSNRIKVDELIRVRE